MIHIKKSMIGHLFQTVIQNFCKDVASIAPIGDEDISPYFRIFNACNRYDLTDHDDTSGNIFINIQI